jgi:hypothetical protein
VRFFLQDSREASFLFLFSFLWACLVKKKSEPKKCYSTCHIKFCGTCIEY